MKTIEYMATLKQKTAISKTCENLKRGIIKPIGEIMVQSGYTKSVSEHPGILTGSKAWLKAMSKIDYAKQLQQVEELGDITKNSDKDNALKAKDMLFKIGDKYPKGETKIVGIFNKIESIQGE